MMAKLTDEEYCRIASGDQDPPALMNTGKTIPYLGWYWREWTEPGGVSLYEDQVWIDEAGKWDYPSTYVSEEDRIRVMKLVTDMGKAKAEVLDILESYKERIIV